MRPDAPREKFARGNYLMNTESEKLARSEMPQAARMRAPYIGNPAGAEVNRPGSRSSEWEHAARAGKL